MNTTNNTPANNYDELDPLTACALHWLDEHPRTANAVVLLSTLLFAFALFFYEFTIPMYK